MISSRAKKIAVCAAVCAAAMAVAVMLYRGKSGGRERTLKKIRPSRGDIALSVTTTGIVEPQNRLEIKPAINGRVEKIMVGEGDKVKTGQILAWMSSTERAAILDIARAQGEEVVKYWEEAYKASPLIAPIDGEVIVRAVEPGQTVTTATPVLVLSDRLIVTAQVDETDIGAVAVGQPAVISLDAYPEIKIKASVDHIAYESNIVNNVTIYEVDVLPDSVPPVFRAGMSANVRITGTKRENVLLLPVEAVITEEGGSFVLVQTEKGAPPRKQPVELGLSDGERVEIASGLSDGDTVVIASSRYSRAERSRQGTNPLLPSRRRSSR